MSSFADESLLKGANERNYDILHGKSCHLGEAGISSDAVLLLISLPVPTTGSLGKSRDARETSVPSKHIKQVIKLENWIFPDSAPLRDLPLHPPPPTPPLPLHRYHGTEL